MAPNFEANKVVIPHHALFRCVERTSISMDEATSVIRSILEDGETQWFSTPPKGVKRKKRQEGVFYGASVRCGVLVVFDENDRSGNGYIATTYKWDREAGEAIA